MFTISTLAAVWLHNTRMGEKFWRKAPPKTGGFRPGQRDITHWPILLNTRPWDGQGSKPLLKITHRCQPVFLGPGRGLSYWLSLFLTVLWFLVLFVGVFSYGLVPMLSIRTTEWCSSAQSGDILVTCGHHSQGKNVKELRPEKMMF